MEIFWRTIAYYNSATWLLQIVIILIGIALTGLLIGRPRPWVKMAMKFYMIGLYTWISNSPLPFVILSYRFVYFVRCPLPHLHLHSEYRTDPEWMVRIYRADTHKSHDC